MTEKRTLTKEELKFLMNLDIRLQHEVPEQHKIGLYSKSLSQKEKEQFNKYCTLKKNRFNPEESAIVKKNWEDFCEIHNWDSDFPEPFARMEYKKFVYYIPEPRNRTKFFQFLAKGLPWRCVPSVAAHFKYLNDQIVKSRVFSANDDKVIMKKMSELKEDDEEKFVKIAKLLKRQPEAIAKRYDALKTTLPSINPKVQMKVLWDLKRMTEFLKHLLELTLSKDVMQLKNAQIPNYVFKLIEERMNIGMSELERLWWIDMHLQLFSPKPIYINDIKIRLIKLLIKLKSNKENFSFDTLSKCFDGTTPRFLKYSYMIILRTAKGCDNLEERLNHLYKHLVPKLRLQNGFSYKCRLQYYKGKIRLHPDDERDVDITHENYSDLSDMNWSSEDSEDNEDAASSIDVGISEARSTPVDTRLSQESGSDSDSSNFSEKMDVENESETRKKSLVPGMEMWDDVVSVQIDNKNSEKENSSTEFCSKFVSNLLDLTLSTNVEKLKNAIIPDVVWEKLETRMNAPKDQLKSYWLLQLHMQLFCPRPLYLNEVKSQIIGLLYDLKVSTFADIQWSNLVYCFDGTTPEFLQHVFDSVLVSINEKYIKTKSFEYILKQLYIHEMRQLKKATYDKRMKRFHYGIEKVKLIPV